MYSINDCLDADIHIRRLYKLEFARKQELQCSVRYLRPAHGLLYIVSGSIDYCYGDERFTVGPGDVVKLPSGVPYSGKVVSDTPVEMYVCNFTTVEEKEYAAFPLPYVLHVADPGSIRGEFARLIDMGSGLEVAGNVLLKGAFLHLLSRLVNEYAVAELGHRADGTIGAVLSFLGNNYPNPDLKISDISQAFYMSDSKLRRLFSEKMGVSPMKYLSNLRIDTAKSLLMAYPELSVQEIAERVGYCSMYYFSNAFKAATGKSPSEYRKCH